MKKEPLEKHQSGRARERWCVCVMAPSVERRGADVASMPLRAAADMNSLRETAEMLDELRNVYGGSDESARMTSIKARREQLRLEASRRGA